MPVLRAAALYTLLTAAFTWPLLARLLTFLLSALSAYLLARELGCGEGPALFAGAAFAFNPIRTDQIAHLSTLGSHGSRWRCSFMHRYFHVRRDAPA